VWMRQAASTNWLANLAFRMVKAMVTRHRTLADLANSDSSIAGEASGVVPDIDHDRDLGASGGVL